MRNEDCGSEENDSEQKRSKEPNVKLRARSDPGTYNLVAASKRSWIARINFKPSFAFLMIETPWHESTSSRHYLKHNDSILF